MIPLGVMAGAHVTPAAALDYDSLVLSSSPVAYWPMSEGTGLPQDLSGNGHHLFENGTGSTTWVTDAGEPALDINVAGYDTTARAPQAGYTVEAWVKRTATGTSDKAIIADWGGVPGAKGVMLYVPTNLRLYHRNVTLDGPPVPIGEWTHIAATWDGTVMRIYVNGSSSWSKAETGAPELGQSSSISGYGNSTKTRHFPGLMRRAAWYPAALPAATVAAHYAAGVA